MSHTNEAFRVIVYACIAFFAICLIGKINGQDDNDPPPGLKKQEIKPHRTVFNYVDKGENVTLYLSGFEVTGIFLKYDKENKTVTLLLGAIGPVRKATFLEEHVLGCVSNLTMPERIKFPKPRVVNKACDTKIGRFGYFEHFENVTIYIKGGRKLGKNTQKKFNGAILYMGEDGRILSIRKSKTDKQGVMLMDRIGEFSIDGFVGIEWLEE